MLCVVLAILSQQMVNAAPIVFEKIGKQVSEINSSIGKQISKNGDALGGSQSSAIPQ